MAHISYVSFICVRQIHSMLYHLLINTIEPIITALQICNQSFSSTSRQALSFRFSTHCRRYLRHSTNPRYSIPQINNYPTTTSGAQILMTIIYACMIITKIALLILLTTFRVIRYGPTRQTLAASCIWRSKSTLS